jgi:hypothetical protein
MVTPPVEVPEALVGLRDVRRLAVRRRAGAGQGDAARRDPLHKRLRMDLLAQGGRQAVLRFHGPVGGEG